MSDSKHTPGPWFLERTNSALWIGIEKAAGGKVGDVITGLDYGEEYNDWHNELALANARLIAAAPELLEVARKAEQLASVASDWNLSEIEIDGQMVSIYVLMDEFRAAIAKAGAA